MQNPSNKYLHLLIYVGWRLLHTAVHSVTYNLLDPRSLRSVKAKQSRTSAVMQLTRPYHHFLFFQPATVMFPPRHFPFPDTRWNTVSIFISDSQPAFQVWNTKQTGNFSFAFFIVCHIYISQARSFLLIFFFFSLSLLLTHFAFFFFSFQFSHTRWEEAATLPRCSHRFF